MSSSRATFRTHNISYQHLKAGTDGYILRTLDHPKYPLEQLGVVWITASEDCNHNGTSNPADATVRVPHLSTLELRNLIRNRNGIKSEPMMKSEELLPVLEPWLLEPKGSVENVPPLASNLSVLTMSSQLPASVGGEGGF